MTRSYLFVPADSEKKFARARESGADALILDLEDSVAAPMKPAARERLPGFLRSGSAAELWVRINPLDSADSEADLQALSGILPTGVVLPKASGADDIRALDGLLASLEKAAGTPPGTTRILPIVTERAAALFRIAEYASVPGRLRGLTWGAEDLAAALGARRNKDDSGEWLGPYQLARSLCLIGAAAAEVPAVETVYTNTRDADGLRAFAAAARRDGFDGMLAIHPAQLDIINAAFTPDAEELERARRIVAIFEDDPRAGVVALDGIMLDRPHYLQARRLLDVAERSASR